MQAQSDEVPQRRRLPTPLGQQLDGIETQVRDLEARLQTQVRNLEARLQEQRWQHEKATDTLRLQLKKTIEIVSIRVTVVESRVDRMDSHLRQLKSHHARIANIERKLGLAPGTVADEPMFVPMPPLPRSDASIALLPGWSATFGPLLRP